MSSLVDFLSALPDEPEFGKLLINDVNRVSGQRKKRLIFQQNQAMKIVHQRLIKYLRDLCVDIDFRFAQGSRPKNSPDKNLSFHRRHRWFYLTDISDAYRSVKMEKLALILNQLDHHDGAFADLQATRDFLSRYCFIDGHSLVMGATASPDLFNIYVAKLVDQPLGELCRQYYLIYTRYLDDFCFSTSQAPIGKRKRKAIRTIIESAGFKISHHKSKVCDLKKGPIVINGIGLIWGGRTFVPRHYLRRLRGLIYRAQFDTEIDPAVIHGMMGVLRLNNRNNKLNQIERKLMSQYCRFQAYLKGKK